MDEGRKHQQRLLFNACESGDFDAVKRIVEANEKAGDEWNMVEIKPDEQQYAMNKSYP